MTNTPNKDRAALQITLRHKVNDAFQYGEETKGLADYKTINVALGLTVGQIMTAIDTYVAAREQDFQERLEVLGAECPYDCEFCDQQTERAGLKEV